MAEETRVCQWPNDVCGQLEQPMTQRESPGSALYNDFLAFKHDFLAFKQLMRDIDSPFSHPWPLSRHYVASKSWQSAHIVRSRQGVGQGASVPTMKIEQL